MSPLPISDGRLPFQETGRFSLLEQGVRLDDLRGRFLLPEEQQCQQQPQQETRKAGDPHQGQEESCMEGGSKVRSETQPPNSNLGFPCSALCMEGPSSPGTKHHKYGSAPRGFLGGVWALAP